MANKNNMEIEIIVNGKSAKTKIDDVGKSFDNLGNNAEKSGDKIDDVFSKIGGAAKVAASAIAVVGASLIAAAGKAAELTKSTFGLSDSMKSYISETAALNGTTQEMVAGFVQTGKAAGLSSGQIKEMIDMATALSRAYPHESTETFIDNLSMLNSTGEAQGYVVDVLEQKWGTLDLKSKSLAEKMEVLREKTAGINKEFNNTAGAKIDQVFSKIGVVVTKVGSIVLKFGEKWGWIDTVSNGLDKLLMKMKSIQEYTKKQAQVEVQIQTDRYKKLKEEYDKAPLKSFNPFTKTKGELRAELINAKQIKAQAETRLKLLDEEKKKEQEITKTKQEEVKKRIKAAIDYDKEIKDKAKTSGTKTTGTGFTDELNKGFTGLLGSGMSVEGIDDKGIDRAQERKKRIVERFSDWYKKTTLSDFDYQREQLNQEVEYYKTILTSKEDLLKLSKIKEQELDKINQDEQALLKSEHQQKEAELQDYLIDTYASVSEKQIIIETEKYNALLELHKDNEKLKIAATEAYNERIKQLNEEQVINTTQTATDSLGVINDFFKGIQNIFSALGSKDSAGRRNVGGAIDSAYNMMVGASGGGGVLPTFHAGHIPTHHSGSFRSDERLAKLQVGEAVINRSGVRQNKKVLEKINRGEKINENGGGAVNSNVNINISAMDANGFASYLHKHGKKVIENTVNNSINNNGSIRKNIVSKGK